MSVNVVAARRDGLPYRISASHVAWFGHRAHSTDGCNSALGSTAAKLSTRRLAAADAVGVREVVDDIEGVVGHRVTVVGSIGDDLDPVTCG